MSNINIICADSEEYLSTIPDNSVDMIITSPPYNFGMGYSDIDDNVNWDSYYNKLFSILDHCYRIIRDGGRIAINVQPNYKLNEPTHHRISDHMKEIGAIWKDEILWEKNNYNCGFCTWGSWKSPSMPYLKYTWEFVEVFCKERTKHDGEKDMADISADEFKKWTTAKWSIAPERNMQQFNHPAMFPEELAERLIKLYSFVGDTIVDPFGGVGTVAIVCKRFERNCISIDISEEYCNTASERLKNTNIERVLF